MENNEIAIRKEIARNLLSEGNTEIDGLLEVDESLLIPEASLMALSDSLEYPDGLGPKPKPISPKPGLNDALPEADVLVVTWTVAEQNALADIMTPGITRNAWYRYRRNYETHLKFGFSNWFSNPKQSLRDRFHFGIRWSPTRGFIIFICKVRRSWSKRSMGMRSG